MKLRLLNVYHDNSCLALLTEHDHFEWIGHVCNHDINLMLKSIETSYKHSLRWTGDNDIHRLMFDTGGAITPEESIHIIGDFENIEELEQWLQMQYLLDNLSVESFKTITK